MPGSPPSPALPSVVCPLPGSWRVRPSLGLRQEEGSRLVKPSVGVEAGRAVEPGGGSGCCSPLCKLLHRCGRKGEGAQGPCCMPVEEPHPQSRVHTHVHTGTKPRGPSRRTVSMHTHTVTVYTHVCTQSNQQGLGRPGRRGWLGSDRWAEGEEALGGWCTLSTCGLKG